MYKATCHFCHKRKDDRKMIYVVGENKYYCDQKAFDQYNGIERDKDGLVILRTEL